MRSVPIGSMPMGSMPMGSMPMVSMPMVSITPSIPITLMPPSTQAPMPTYVPPAPAHGLPFSTTRVIETERPYFWSHDGYEDALRMLESYENRYAECAGSWQCLDVHKQRIWRSYMRMTHPYDLY